MKRQIHGVSALLVAGMMWGSGAYASCTNAEFSGTWELAFSDGNSCRLVVDKQGEVIAPASACFDPFRGSTAPDSGTIVVGSDCSATGSIVVEGVTVELAAQIARTRDSGAGRYLVPAYAVKGAISLIRTP